MNRSILIIICDFLLVSLLAFSTVDLGKLADEGTTPEVRSIIVTNAPERGKDLAAVMKLALDEEKDRRDLLLSELASSRTTASEREKQVQKYEQELKAQSQNFQQTLQEREREALQLKQQRTELQTQYAAAQSNLQTLGQKLQTISADASTSKEKLSATEAELRKRAEEAAAIQRRLEELAKSNQVVLSEREQLAGKLQVAEIEKQNATRVAEIEKKNAARQVAQFQEQVQIERAEKDKLADGVKTLAVNSGALVQEIRENRPLAPNTIFSEYLANRVMATINGTRPGIFVGEATKQKETRTVLVSDGTNTFALCHVEDTPVTFWTPGTEWQRFAGTLGRNNAAVPIRSLSFHFRDPRVVIMPVTAAEAQQLGGKVYQTSSTPFKFQDVVLAGVGDDYYGECRFEIDTATPGYLKLDRSVVKGLFGKFNPSRGDLVFSRTGELLGIMANNTYCLMLRSFETAATFPFGSDLSNQSVGPTLSAFQSAILRMPLKLQ